MINEMVSNNWITMLFIILFGVLVLVNYFFEKRFQKFKAFFRTKQYFVSYISITTVFHPFNLLLLIFQLGVFSLLVVKGLLYYKIILVEDTLSFFFKISLIILGYYVFRYFIGKLFGFIFNLIREQEGLSFVKFTYLSKISLLIFPFLILLNFIDYKNGVLFIALIYFLALYLLLKYLTILQQNQKIIFRKKYYFILYLCILEISPLLFLYKVLIFKN